MKTFTNVSDDDLLLALQAGDKHAFEAIYNRYWQLLYQHARGMLKSEEEAKDVVQDVFTSLWTKIGESSIHPPLAAFLYTATRNRILNLLKHLKIESKYADHVKKVIENPAVLPDAYVIERELANRIEEGIQNLPPKMREIFELSRRSHKTHKEISEELNISDKTVKRQVSNAITILKGKINILLTLF